MPRLAITLLSLLWMLSLGEIILEGHFLISDAVLGFIPLALLLGTGSQVVLVPILWSRARKDPRRAVWLSAHLAACLIADLATFLLLVMSPLAMGV